MQSLEVDADALPYEVGPLSDALSFGSFVFGLRGESLKSRHVQSALFSLWIDRGVLVFRDGESSADMQVALSRCFGELEKHAFPETWVEGHPELVKVKYYPEDGTCYEIDGELRGGWLPWHSDLIYTDRINRGGILRPMELPPSIGLTGFIDQIAAYERLPQDLRAEVADLHVVYGMDLNVANHKFGRPEQIRFVRGAKSFYAINQREYQYPRVIHPLVFTQQETGRKVLNVSPAFALGLYERGGPDGDALLARIVEHCLNEAQAYFHKWQAGDMVLWDNWRTLHCATGVRPDETRVMWRTTIAGDYALGRALGCSPAAAAVDF